MVAIYFWQRGVDKMDLQSVGCIGGGRITRIMLAAFVRAGKLPKTVVVSDTSAEILTQLQATYPGIRCIMNGNEDAASQDLVFLALHPPVAGDVIPPLLSQIQKDTVVISLMPKISAAKISQMLGGHPLIVRMIPNAPAIIGKGFNPVVYPTSMPADKKKALATLFTSFGACPEVNEEHLEAYAVISAMGPTYLWFQLYELQQIAESFGLLPADASDAVNHMALGSIATMIESGLSSGEVMDLVPVKPLGVDEPAIREMYRKRLTELYGKLKG
jgi:pyrroline-5-carboxylate reductase